MRQEGSCSMRSTREVFRCQSADTAFDVAARDGLEMLPELD
jgi:hypothetical protein